MKASSEEMESFAGVYESKGSGKRLIVIIERLTIYEYRYGSMQPEMQILYA
jgi:hypothetical protein